MFQTWYISDKRLILWLHAKPFSEASGGEEGCFVHTEGNGYRLAERFALNSEKFMF